MSKKKRPSKAAVREAFAASDEALANLADILLAAYPDCLWPDDVDVETCNRLFSLVVHVIGLYLNLQGVPDAYSDERNQPNGELLIPFTRGLDDIFEKYAAEQAANN
jgi:hypothetical protein